MVELDPRVKIIVIIGIIIFIFSGIPFKFIKNTVYPPQINITPNVTPIIIYRDVIITVTPTYDGIKYFASEMENGTRKMLRPFTFERPNAIGKQKMKVTSRVYDYRVFDSVHLFDDTEFKYYEKFPTDQNNKFLFVMFNCYLDDISGDDTRLWLPFSSMFWLYADDKILSPSEIIPKYQRVQELENTNNYQDSYPIKPFGYTVEYNNKLEYAKTAGMQALADNYLMGGKSNAKDGWILFEVDKLIDISQLKFMVRYGNMGGAEWLLEK